MAFLEKLSDEQIVELANRYLNETTLVELAREEGISPKHLLRAVVTRLLVIDTSLADRVVAYSKSGSCSRLQQKVSDDTVVQMAREYVSGSSFSVLQDRYFVSMSTINGLFTGRLPLLDTELYERVLSIKSARRSRSRVYTDDYIRNLVDSIVDSGLSVSKYWEKYKLSISPTTFQNRLRELQDKTVYNKFKEYTSKTKREAVYIGKPDHRVNGVNLKEAAVKDILATHISIPEAEKKYGLPERSLWSYISQLAVTNRPLSVEWIKYHENKKSLDDINILDKLRRAVERYLNSNIGFKRCLRGEGTVWGTWKNHEKQFGQMYPELYSQFLREYASGKTSRTPPRTTPEELIAKTTQALNLYINEGLSLSDCLPRAHISWANFKKGLIVVSAVNPELYREYTKALEIGKKRKSRKADKRGTNRAMSEIG